MVESSFSGGGMKKLIGGTTQLNNLAPFAHAWAWEMANKSMANHWTPHEIGMGKDKFCYENDLNYNERHLFFTVLATLTTSDIAVLKNIAVAIFERITAPEVQLYLGRQIAEETIHSVCYQHCIEVIGLPQDEIYSLYERIPEIKQKFDLANAYSQQIAEFKSLDSFIEGLVFYYLCFEGGWFYNGFSPIFSLQRRNLMPGTGEQLQYIMRDESMHAAFGVRLIRELIKETGVALEQANCEVIIHQAVEAEKKYAKHAIPDVVGYNAAIHIQQLKFLMDRRLKQIGLKPMYNVPPAINWLDEQVNIRKEKNFFESRVTEYQVGQGLVFDENNAMENVSNWSG